MNSCVSSSPPAVCTPAFKLVPPAVAPLALLTYRHQNQYYHAPCSPTLRNSSHTHPANTLVQQRFTAAASVFDIASPALRNQIKQQIKQKTHHLLIHRSPFRPRFPSKCPSSFCGLSLEWRPKRITRKKKKNLDDFFLVGMG